MTATGSTTETFIGPSPFLYIGFIFVYFIAIVYWAISNGLLNNDLSIESSWQRHLGVVILGIVIFLLSKIFAL